MFPDPYVPACVRGRVQAPRVQTWFMHMGHLNWQEGSGAELREDEVYAGREHLWKTDPVWLRANGLDHAIGAPG